MKKLYLIIIVICSIMKANAQYEEIRFPQDSTEPAFFAKLGVKHILQQVVNKTSRENMRIKSFDEKGHLLASIDKGFRRYYIYDDEGRMTSCLDSTLKGTIFKVNEYHFTYDSASRIKTFSDFNYSSSFKYDKTKRMAIETIKKNDGSLFTRYYYYNSFNKLKEVKEVAPDSKLTFRKTYTWSAAGLLYNESETKYIDNNVDSTYIVYQYNSDKKLSRKIIFNFNILIVSEKDNYKKTSHMGTIYTNGIYTYRYDDKGRILTIEYVNQEDKLAYLYRAFNYDDLNLVAVEKVKEGIGDLLNIEYVYDFYVVR